MRARLYLKILGWFLLNLLLLAAAGLIFLRTQFDFDLNSLLSGRAGSQVEAVSRLIEADLAGGGPSDWDAVLRRYDSAYGVRFSIYRPDGVAIAGVTNALPPEVEQRFARLRPPRPGSPGLPPPGTAAPPPRPDGPPEPFERALVYTRHPATYWALAEITLPPPQPGAPLRRGILLIRSGTLNANGLFFDVRPWLLAGAAMVLASALFWLPFVGRITGSLTRMTEATRRIADGDFDVTVESRTRDELGALAEAINRMAGRLDGFVSGQRRFLGDIAHELCAPLARIQVGLGILEARIPAGTDAAIADVREEADQMSALVNELLAFSKAALGESAARLGSVDVRVVAERAVRRESAVATFHIAEGLTARADEHLLERAVANLLRNAMRHAAGQGIEITGTLDGGEVVLSVADDGPGVPEASVARIFDPFFRLDASRSRDTGGVGLGLAIVRTCVESCGGRVSCRNRPSSGLEVTMRFPAAVAEATSDRRSPPGP